MSINVLFDESIRKASSQLPATVEPFRIDEYLLDVTQEATTHIENLIPEHLVRFKLAACVMLYLEKFSRQRYMTRQQAAFAASQVRATNLLLGIYRLIIAGFEETARPLTRAYLEANDIALVMLTNEALCEEYWGGEGSSKDFWERYIAYGKVNAYLRVAFREANLSEDQIEEKLSVRRNLKSILSSSVHADDAGAFRSLALPPMGYPDMLSLETRGVANLHTPNHIASVIDETYTYVVTIIKMIIDGKYERRFARPEDEESREEFIVHYLALQNRMMDEDLPDGKDIVAPDYAEKTKRD